MLVLISNALNAITAKYLLEQAQDAALVTDEDILNYEIDDQLGNYYASTIRVFLEMTRPLIGSVIEVCSENLDTDEGLLWALFGPLFPKIEGLLFEFMHNW